MLEGGKLEHWGHYFYKSFLLLKLPLEYSSNRRTSKRICALQCDLKYFFYPLVIGTFGLNLLGNTSAKEEVFLIRKMLLFLVLYFLVMSHAIPNQVFTIVEMFFPAGLVLLVLQKMVVTTVKNTLQCRKT